MRRLGTERYARSLDVHRQVVRRALHAHDGVERNTQGDSFFASFPSPSSCLAAAIEIQLRLAAFEWPDGEPVSVRIGIHTGEVTTADDDIVGYEVHRAARIGAIAHGGQILVSASSAALLRDALPEGVALLELGDHLLKDLGRPETIFQVTAPGLRRGFPELRSLGATEVPNNLPRALSPFIGRSREIADLRELLAGARLVTLSGPGGSGKTRLALEVAAELVRAGRCPVWFVELAQIRDHEFVPSALLVALGLRQEGDVSAIESIIESLRDQHVWIILDNCEHVIEHVAKIADLIVRSCPAVGLLVTSREPLGVDGEEVFRVGTLSLPGPDADDVASIAASDAVELFVARAQSRDRTFALSERNATVVASICRRLDGIPLAIELAAARTASMSVFDLSARLDQRFRLLSAASRNALPRQQTLGALVGWSYDLLHDTERLVLRRLSVFAGGFHLKAAEDVCASEDLDTFDVTELIGSLVNKSLVTAERGPTSLRYRLLETIRQFASERLIEIDGDAEAARLSGLFAAHFMALAEEAAPGLLGDEQDQWLALLDAEWDNLLAAMVQLARDPESVTALLRCYVAARQYVLSRVHREPFALVGAVLDTDPVVDPALLAASLLAWAKFASVVMRSDRALLELAVERCDRALRIVRQLGDAPNEAMALALLSQCCRALGRHDEARAAADEAVAVARACRDDLVLGDALYAQGQAQARFIDGRPLVAEALGHFRAARHWFSVTRALNTLGAMAMELEGIDGVEAGRVMFAETVPMCEASGDTWMLPLAELNLAVCCTILGLDAEAAARSQSALRLLRRQGRGSVCGDPLMALSCCATRAGQFERAALLCGAGEAIRERESEAWSLSLYPVEAARYDANRAEIVAAIGAEAFDRLRAAGAALDLDEAVQLALEVPAPLA